MVNKNEIIAIPPGETIKEQLEIHNMNQKEFAKRLGYSEKHVSEIINGKASITQETSLKLESILGIPASFWNNLEAIYQEDLARIRAEEEIEKEIEIAKKIPYNQMAKYEWIDKTRDNKEKVINLRNFFRVASLSLIPNIDNFAVAFRKLDNGNASNLALSAWLQQGRRFGESIQTEPFNKSKLKKCIEDLRNLVIKSPKEFEPQMKAICESCGIALVFLPHLPKTYAHGATQWYNSNKALIQLSIRGKDADKFWFSFFHEIGHSVKHGIKNVYVNFDKEELKDIKEQEADEFARNILIPKKEYDLFTAKGIFTEKSITEFAKKINMLPGIVVGRLQYDKYIPYTHFHYLKTKYEWVKDEYRYN